MSKNNYLKQGSFDYFVKGLDFWRRDILDRLDKIEQKPNFTRTADPHKCFVCGEPADVGRGNAFGPQRGYCRKHIPEMEREYRGPKHEVIPPMQMDYSDTQIRSNFPLNAKVAKAIGRKLWQYADGTWYFHSRSDSTWESMIIPDYPNDLVAANEGWVEYLTKAEMLGIVIYGYCLEQRVYRAGIGDNPDEALANARSLKRCDSEAEARCFAIVAHSEGK